MRMNGVEFGCRSTGRGKAAFSLMPKRVCGLAAVRGCICGLQAGQPSVGGGSCLRGTNAFHQMSKTGMRASCNAGSLARMWA